MPSVGKPGRLSQSLGKAFFLCMGRTRFRARYSPTVPELQGGEGWQESLMAATRDIPGWLEQKGIKCCWINNCIRIWQTASLQLWEGNRDWTVLCLHLTNFFIQLQAEINISQICADLQMFKNSGGLLHSCLFLMTCFLTSVPQSPFIQIKRKKLPRTVVFPETEILQT